MQDNTEDIKHYLPDQDCQRFLAYAKICREISRKRPLGIEEPRRYEEIKARENQEVIELLGRKEDSKRRDAPIPPISGQGEISIQEKLCSTNPVLEKVRRFLKDHPSSWLELREEMDRDYSWLVPKPFQGREEYREWFWLYVVSDAVKKPLWQLPASGNTALRFARLAKEWTGLTLREDFQDEQNLGR